MTAPTRLALSLAVTASLTALAPPAAAAAAAEPGVIRDENGCRFANPSPKRDERVTWSGECRDGWGDGRGTLQWYVNGAPVYTYVGMVAAGKLEGEGTENIGGDRYVGHFADGHRQGHGVFTWHDGLRYEGEFVRGQMAGQGALALGHGVRFEGRFVNNLLQAPATLVKTTDGAELRLPVEMTDDDEAPPAPVASAASAAHGVRIRVDSTCRPNYPVQAVRQVVMGTSMLALRIEPGARVSRARIEHRSGADFMHQLLDLSALAGLVDCPFEYTGSDTAAQWMRVDYVWKLE
jgi:hypothetical protein